VHPWRLGPSDDDDIVGTVFFAAQPMPQPKIPDVHTQPAVIAAFDALLAEPKRKRRRPPVTPPPPPPADDNST
jgi:hypothetical protein